ncbi:MAG: V-type ATP synthase subunit A [Promethearchaeota archaeon]
MTSGKISRVAGSLITAKGIPNAKMFELVRIGESGIFGEIIRISGDTSIIQAYEETEGIKLGEKIIGTGKPLSVDLGPGVMGQIFDGIQRPLTLIAEKSGTWIQRGIDVPSIDRNKKWHFVPQISKGVNVIGGDIIGEVQETPSIVNRIMIPPKISGVVISICSEGDYTVTETIAEIKTPKGIQEVYLMQTWPVRKARPYKKKLDIDTPLLTGQRIIDSFFPVAKGGIIAIIGGFGTGKTVLLHTIAVWIEADIILYIGCGERGNEIADIMESFSRLKKNESDHPFMSKSVLIANTSNMPILAREASIYSGITIAEYYRDMGYNVAIMADSTSRWAEALREISGRLEEMPGEEGYPAYLASRLAQYYSRAGCIKTIGADDRDASITVLSSISPPGGDFSEPVTNNTLRLAKVFWALDFNLAHRRHYPAVDWFMSYSEYTSFLEDWFQRYDPDWQKLCGEAKALLREEEKLKEIVSLIGTDILGDSQRSVFEIAKMLKEHFMVQNAYHPVDAYCPIQKTTKMLRILLKFGEKTKAAIKLGVTLQKILALPVRAGISRLKTIPIDEFDLVHGKLTQEMNESFEILIQEAKKEESVL